MAARLAHYGIQPSGQIAPLESLAHLDEAGLEMARLLRDLLAHKRARSPEAKVWKAFDGAVYDLLQEQGFTALNRLCALRMAEERKLIIQCVGKGQQSEGFELFEYHTGKTDESYPVEVRYQQFLYAFFDELALDLGALFARYSPQGLLFPSPQALAALLAEINHPDLAPLWAEDETIGWIYQYWNSQEERRAMRDASASPRNSRELAVRNQFFTPRYVVEFLTDNTLGRIWYEMMQGRTMLKEQCRYLVRRPNEIFLAPGETASETPVADNLSQEELLRQPVHIPHRPLKDPREIRLLDPACGSMHFGLYAFDLFEAIYAEAWDLAERSKAEGGANTPEFLSFARLVASFPSKAAFLREVPRLIIEHNIHGIDIDPRAAQVAGLSLWLRAQRTWHRQNVPASERPAIRRSNIVCAEPMPGEKELLREFVEQTFPLEERPIFQRLLEAVFEKMQLAGEAGSLLKIEEEIQTAIAEARTRWKAGPRLTQGLLFGGGDPTTAQDELDLSGVTDELFWERVEDRIYAALGEYAAQAESTGYSRRLFAEDTAKGFAFIEICRKRYEAVVMNPPFGACTSMAKRFIEEDYPFSRSDIYGAFIERGVGLLEMRGFIGAITNRTGFFLKAFRQWREDFILPNAVPSVFADLGSGVLDAALVETAAYCLSKADRAGVPTVFFRLIGSADRAGDLQKMISNYEPESPVSRFDIHTATFLSVPGSPFAYWTPSELLRSFKRFPAFQSEGRIAAAGGNTGDNFRFVRTSWETPASAPSWMPYAKGGAYSPYYYDTHLCLNWEEDGAEMKSYLVAYRSSKGWSPHWKAELHGSEHYGRRGITWPRRTSSRLSARTLPSGCVFGDKGPGAFVSGNDCSALMALLALMNSNVFHSMVDLQVSNADAAARSYEVGIIQNIPIPVAGKIIEQALSERVLRIWRNLRDLDSVIETSHAFLLPFPSLKQANDLASCSSIWNSYMSNLLLENKGIENEIEQYVSRLYRLDLEQVQASDTVLEENLKEQFDEDEGGSVSGLHVIEGAATVPTNLTAYFFGSAFGRWDIRFATGERQSPELPDPFAPLPVCPPGMLQNTAGLPAGPEDVPADYPVKNIPWDGILVDDPEHPLDIERRIREVMEIIWTGQNGAPNAAAIEAEACELLEVRSLREYFRKPAGFFADHLKRYSKSRRKAPIYWPLSTPSGGYTIWLYYHRLNDGTLYKVVEQFVEPKQAEVQATFQTLAAKESRSRAEDRELENAQTLLVELAAFRDDLLRLAKIWKPNLNDGVVITAAPLWRHFRLPAWQKELRTTWESLERGEYDWAHLAYSLWPERVTEKCKTDRSLAIAHNLEHLCTVEPPKPKKKRTKAKVDTEEQEGELL